MAIEIASLYVDKKCWALSTPTDCFQPLKEGLNNMLAQRSLTTK